MKDVFPESLGQERVHVLYMGVHYTEQNTVLSEGSASLRRGDVIAEQETQCKPVC